MKNLRLTVFILIGMILMVVPFLSACGEEEAQTQASTSEETIVLRFGGQYMEGQLFSKVEEAWLDKIEADTNGKVQFERYWGGTLTKGSLDEIAEGLADIGHVSLTFSTIGNDYYNALSPLFSSVPNRTIRVRIYQDLCRKFPEIKDEWGKVKVLCVGATTPMQLITGENSVRTVEDFEGMMIGAYPWTQPFFVHFGATCSSIPAADMYVSLEKGMVDAFICPLDSLKSFRLAELSHYVTMLNWASMPFYCVGINWDTWNSLPADIQKVFEDNEDYFLEVDLMVWDELLEESFALAEEYEIELIELSPEERQKVNEAFDAVAEQKVAELDSKGFRGTEIWEECQRLMKAYGVR